MENIIEAGSNSELLLKEEVTNWLDNGIGQQDGRNDMMARDNPYLHLHHGCYFKTCSFVRYTDAGCPGNEFLSITTFQKE